MNENNERQLPPPSPNSLRYDLPPPEEALGSIATVGMVEKSDLSKINEVSLEQQQEQLNQSVTDIMMKTSDDVELFDAVGRMLEATDRIGVDFSDAQKQSVIMALRGRGFKSIEEYHTDQGFLDANNNNPESVEAEGIVGNVLYSLEQERPIPRPGVNLAYAHRDKLIAQQQAANN